MKRINTILKNAIVPSLAGGLGWVFLLASCGNKASSLADVAEEDSLFIDTVATLDEELPPDTLAVDSLVEDSL